MLTIDQLTDIASQAMIDNDWPRAEFAGDLLGQYDPPRSQAATLLESALWYAGEGLRVFPLRPGQKTPMTAHGVHDATTDPTQITAWWTRTPRANIGIATGHGLDVIDIDGPAGVQTWLAVDSNDEHYPDILGSVSTPRPDGIHLWVRSTGEGNSAALWEGIDYRGIGGYVVAPPSQIAEGQPNPGIYEWSRHLVTPRGMAAAA